MLIFSCVLCLHSSHSSQVWGTEVVSVLRLWLLRVMLFVFLEETVQLALQVCRSAGCREAPDSNGLRYAWSQQNCRRVHGPLWIYACPTYLCVSGYEWGCISLHGSSCTQQELTCSVPPFPASFVVWLSDSVREVLSPLHPTGGGTVGLGCAKRSCSQSCPISPCKQECLSAALGWLSSQTFFHSVVCAAWLPFCLEKPFPAKMPQSFIRSKYVWSGFDRVLLGSSSFSHA